jgi:KDO2-lipid IV(A) lauroyltransferase
MVGAYVPFSIAQFLGRMLGALVFMIPLSRKRAAFENILLSFNNNMGKRDAKRLLLKVFLHFGQMLFEVPHVMRLCGRNVHRYVTFEHEENLLNASRKNKGVLAFTGHVGNWELMSAAFAIHFGSGAVVARPIDFSPFDKLMRDIRTRCGMDIIPKQHSMRKLMAALKQNKTIGILLDQNVDWYEGEFVNFLGRMACTNKGLALIAMKTGAPVVPIFSVRQGDGRYRIVIEKEVELINTGDRVRDVQDNTTLFTNIIESYVRKHPDQWFWFHNRWKTKNYCEMGDRRQSSEGQLPANHKLRPANNAKESDELQMREVSRLEESRGSLLSKIGLKRAL